MAVTLGGKSPTDTDDFGIEWADQLYANETITQFTATVISGGANKVNQTILLGTRTYVRLSGGTAGTPIEVRVIATTSLGRQLTQTMTIPVIDA